MAQQHTHTPAARCTTKIPEYSSAQSAHTIDVFVFLEADASSERIFKMRATEWRRAKFNDTEASRALSVAIHALDNKACDALKRVVDRGHLPFCWHGTKFTHPATNTPFWPFPPNGGNPAPWTRKQIADYAAQQREELGEALL